MATRLIEKVLSSSSLKEGRTITSQRMFRLGVTDKLNCVGSENLRKRVLIPEQRLLQLVPSED